MNKNSIITETELLTDIRFYDCLTTTDFGGEPPIVTNLMADRLDISSRSLLDKAAAAGFLELITLELEDLQSVPNEFLDIGLSLSESCSLWYATRYDMVALGCSSYWHKITFSGLKLISYSEPALLFGAMQKLYITTSAVDEKLNSNIKKQYRR